MLVLPVAKETYRFPGRRLPGIKIVRVLDLYAVLAVAVDPRGSLADQALIHGRQ